MSLKVLCCVPMRPVVSLKVLCCVPMRSVVFSVLFCVPKRPIVSLKVLCCVPKRPVVYLSDPLCTKKYSVVYKLHQRRMKTWLLWLVFTKNARKAELYIVKSMKIANKHILKKIHHLLSIDRRDLGVGLSQFLMFKTSFVRLDTPDIRSTFQKSKKKLFWTLLSSTKQQMVSVDYQYSQWSVSIYAPLAVFCDS